MASIALENVAEPTDLLLTPSEDGRARFSRDAYHRLVDAGVLNEDCHVELIDGEIFMMSPIGPPQGGLITRLMQFFVDNLAKSLQCRVQLPIVVADHSEPEPDIAIVRRRDDDYQNSHPIPADVVLLVEIAQSSLQFDVGKKLRLYAASGIGEYWVIDVNRKIVLVHRKPENGTYADISTMRRNDIIAPLAAPECRLDLNWLFH